jgi:glyoxylase-like metal-dependent hydrolase (beta-lactamase superfamily II)
MPTRLNDWTYLLALRTPTLPPATTTNTLVVAGERIAIIEPATPHEEELAALETLVARLRAEGRVVQGLVLTHHHRDHIGCARLLRERWEVPIYAHPATAALIDVPVDEPLEDGDRIDLGGGVALTAMHTPGHAPGHLVLQEERSGLAHAGDMVAGVGTILVSPEDGDMQQYLQSLARLRDHRFTALIPAHGPVLSDARGVCERYIAHRLQRERKILAAIGAAPVPVEEVLARAYDDTPASAWPLAAASLESHLRKLAVEGAIDRLGDHVVLSAHRS